MSNWHNHQWVGVAVDSFDCIILELRASEVGRLQSPEKASAGRRLDLDPEKASLSSCDDGLLGRSGKTHITSTAADIQTPVTVSSHTSDGVTERQERSEQHQDAAGVSGSMRNTSVKRQAFQTLLTSIITGSDSDSETSGGGQQQQRQLQDRTHTDKQVIIILLPVTTYYRCRLYTLKVSTVHYCQTDRPVLIRTSIILIQRVCSLQESVTSIRVRWLVCVWDVADTNNVSKFNLNTHHHKLMGTK